MQCKCTRTSVQLAARCATFVALVAAVPAHAQQFVLVDQTYTATADNTDESHFVAELKSGIPANFLAPIDYANGTVHVDLEIQEAPSSTLTNYNICLHNSSNYACLPYVPYMGEGSHDADPVFNMIWNWQEVDWAQGVNKVELILKNQGEQLVHANADFYPYKAHLKLWVVAKGATFDPTKDNTTPPAAGSGGSPASAGRGGASAQAGQPASAGKSGSSANGSQSGSASNSGGSGTGAATAGKAAGGTGVVGTAGTAGTKPNQPAATAGRAGNTSSTSNAAGGGVDAGADTEASRSIREQLENTSGCSVGASGGSGIRGAWSAWPLLALGALALRRKRRAVSSACHN